MPVHIERLTSSVSVSDRQLSLTAAQIEQLVTLVIARLEDRARDALRAHAATHVAHGAVPPLTTDR